MYWGADPGSGAEKWGEFGLADMGEEGTSRSSTIRSSSSISLLLSYMVSTFQFDPDPAPPWRCCMSPQLKPKEVAVGVLHGWV